MASAPAVVWTHRARTDLLEALEYLCSEGALDAARSFLAEVEAAAASLDQFPERGSRVNEVGAGRLRQLLVGRYRLVYRTEPGAVGIVALIHTSQDLQRAWGRRPG